MIINKLKTLFTSISIFTLILLFQNCSQEAFQTKSPVRLTSVLGNSTDQLNLPSENSDEVDRSDPLFDLPTEDDNASNIESVIPNLTAAATATGKSYYLSPSGKDSNPGTLSLPWKTLDRLQAAQSILKPGDTVYFRGGNYIINDASKSLDAYKNYAWAKGTSVARITFKNYGSEKPVIVYDRRIIDKSKGHTTLLMPGSYNIVEGLTFRQTEASRCIALTNNCLVRKENYYSVRVTPVAITTTNVIFRNCVIDNFSGVGMPVRGPNALVEKSTFINNANHGLYLQRAYGIFRNNVIDGSRQINGGGRYGIQFQYESTHHNKVYGNIIKNTVSAAVIFSGKVSYNEVYNNVIINSARVAGEMLSTWTEDGPVGVGNRFYNNTVIGNTSRDVFGGKIAEFSKLDIRDNIFYPSKLRKIGLTGSYAKIQNNIFYNISGPVLSGNMLKNPLLVNPMGTTSASAMLKSGSPAINTGKSSIFPLVDYNGRKRPQGGKYDIGAFEY